MLYEFALLPEVIEEAITKPDESGQRDLLNLLQRIRENGSLVDLRNGEWSSHVFTLLMQSNGAYVDDIRELLKNLSDYNRIVPHGVGSKALRVNWIDAADDARSNCRFEGVYLSRDAFNQLANPPKHYIPFPNPPSSNAVSIKWQGKRSHKLRKCESEFRDALSPLFRHATRVDLVDPYLNCHRVEYQKTLNLCIDLLQTSTAQQLQLFVHAGDPQRDHQHHPESPATRADAWRTYLQSIKTRRPITFRVFLWGDRLPDRVHNRYIFTDQHVGIKIGHGLDCHDPSRASHDDWDLKDVDEADAILRGYTSLPIYNRLESVFVVRK